MFLVFNDLDSLRNTDQVLVRVKLFYNLIFEVRSYYFWSSSVGSED